jgi:hypothetical protein
LIPELAKAEFKLTNGDFKPGKIAKVLPKDEK